MTKKEAIIKYFSSMDLEMLGLVLDESRTYQEATKEIFLENLPATFNRQTYVSIGLKLSIPDKTAQRYIKDFVTAGILQTPSFDCYIYPTASNTQ